MATPEMIKLLEGYIGEREWITLSRTVDGGYIISGVPCKISESKSGLYYVQLNPFLNGPDQKGVFQIVEKPAAVELPFGLPVALVVLPKRRLDDLIGGLKVGF